MLLHSYSTSNSLDSERAWQQLIMKAFWCAFGFTNAGFNRFKEFAP